MCCGSDAPDHANRRRRAEVGELAALAYRFWRDVAVDRLKASAREEGLRARRQQKQFLYPLFLREVQRSLEQPTTETGAPSLHSNSQGAEKRCRIENLEADTPLQGVALERDDDSLS